MSIAVARVPGPRVPDAVFPDALVPEALVPDALVPDAQVVDAPLRDARTPDAPLRTRYVPARELHLRHTLRGLAQWGSDPTTRREPGSAWFALRTDAGTATLRLVERGGGVDAWAWGAGASEALHRVPGLCGAHDDDTGFEAAHHPLIAELHRRSPGLRLARTGIVLTTLIQAVFFQKVTGREASTAWSRLVRRHGERAPGPAPAGLTVAPTAAAWRLIPSWEWHRAGVTPQRADTIQRVLAVASGLDRLADASADAAQRGLRTVRGVGEWTAAETVQRSHGATDAVSFGDFHVCKTLGWALTGARVDDDGMRELLEPWAGQRQRVVRLIELSGISYERHGPKLTIPDHRAI